MPYSKAEFDDLVLTDAEKKSIRELKKYGKMKMNQIDCFDELFHMGFLVLAHPDEVIPDGYGGYITDNIYMLSEKYADYVAYLQRSRAFKALEYLGEVIPVPLP